MDKQAVLEKIKKCLALSKSANEHEAAQAMKQAQVLMKKYEVDAVDVVLSEVSEKGCDRQMAFKLASWQWKVAKMVADIFGCESYKRGKTMMFYGLGNRAEIAAYTFDMVYRQISVARREFLKTCQARKPANRTYLADQFCEGWLAGAWNKVKKFEMSDEEKTVMDGYTEKEHKGMPIAATRDAKSSKLEGTSVALEALMLGNEAGKKVQLHHAMNGKEGVKQIGEQK
ncbi:MAG: DUF2786 domain-containing protein [Neisseria sp.]|nr:DUF2786 domain-containing protein [Neisseria sp.]